MGKLIKPLLVWLFILLIAYFAFDSVLKTNIPSEEIPYNKFIDDVQQGAIKEVNLNNREIKGTYKGAEEKKFKTYLAFDDPNIMKLLVDNKVEVKNAPQNETPWWIVVVNILPYLLLFGFFILLMRQAQGGGNQAFNFGRSRAKLLTEKWQKVTFKNVAGVDEAVSELQEVVDFLKDPEKYRKLGARIPKGVLLLGAPGTGKTLLGRAIAGEAGVPFYYISGSDFVEMFVGVGASRVRDLFGQAKKSAPCIVFVDEIDAVGRQRGAGLGGGHDEREQTLNQLLVEMDGFEPNNGVIIVAATNRPDVLDPALLRPGRFDRHVVVDKPDMKGRAEILGVHAVGKPLEENIDLTILARRTPGFTGADLENLLNEAALLTARNNMKIIEMHQCEEAIDRVLMGPERKSRVIMENEKEIITYHEAGHAIVAKVLPDADPVRKISILPRGMALGVTWQLPAEDRYLKNKKELLAEIAVLMGGRVAEQLVFDEITTGASNDIKEATKIARNMVTRYGMSQKLGPIDLAGKHEHVFLGRDIVDEKNHSEEIANQIDREVRQLVDECFNMAVKILKNNMDNLKKVVMVLREKEVLDGEELDEILGGNDIKEINIKVEEPEKTSFEIENYYPLKNE